MARLGDIATYINGYAFKPTDWSDEGVQIIRIQDLTGNSYQANRYNGTYDSKYEVNKGDVLISWSASLGVYIWTGETAVLNQHIFKVKFDKTEIDKSFFVHQVENILENASYEAHGATMKHLTKPVFDALPFYLPPIDEQKRIAAELDKVGTLISLRKQQLAKLDELVKARFVELFGNVRDNEKNWEKVSLKSVAEVRGRVGWKGYKKDDLRESGPLVLGATHLTESGCIDLSSPVYLSREKYEESPEIMLQKNDLIFTQRGNTIGKVGLLENDIGEATINPCVLILRPLSINPIYFKTYFILDETKSDMWSLNAGSAQPMITQKGIGEYMLMLPPLKLQERFAAFVEQTDKSKSAIQQSLNKLETLKRALMQKYFG